MKDMQERRMKMKQIEFERALKRHCIKHRADCTECDLRLYCHIPPIERTDAMMLSVIKYLEQDTDEYAALEHHPGCPLEIRFEGAVGYKEWNESTSQGAANTEGGASDKVE